MSSKELTFQEMKEIKNVYLAKKQGEALERASTPLTADESIALGNFGFQAVYAIGIIKSHQDFITSLTTYKGTILKDFCNIIGRASGSIEAMRMEKTFDAVGQLGQFIPEIKRDRQAPEKIDLND